MKKIFHEKIPADEIDRGIGVLKEAIDLSDPFQVGYILEQLEAECKRVLSLFNGVSRKEIDDLRDANAIFWIKEFYPPAPPFEEALHALAAVFSIKEAYASRDSYQDDFATWIKEDADNLGDLLKLMILAAELEEKRARAHFNLEKGRNATKKAEAIWAVYHRFLTAEPRLTHDNLIKRITGQITNEGAIEYSSEEKEKTYHIFLNPEPEETPFKPFNQEDLDTHKILAPAKSTLYRHYYLNILKTLCHKKN